MESHIFTILQSKVKFLCRTVNVTLFSLRSISSLYYPICHYEINFWKANRIRSFPQLGLPWFCGSKSRPLCPIRMFSHNIFSVYLLSLISPTVKHAPDIPIKKEYLVFLIEASSVPTPLNYLRLFSLLRIIFSLKNTPEHKWYKPKEVFFIISLKCDYFLTFSSIKLFIFRKILLLMIK